MKIALCILSALFAALSIIAALSQLGKAQTKPPLILMAVGGLLLLVGALFRFLDWQGDVLDAALGCGMICAAAIWNGKQSGQFHLPHHVVRIACSILLILGFLFL